MAYSAYVAWKQNGRRGVRPKLKAYSEMANEEKALSEILNRLSILPLLRSRLYVTQHR
ncbi:MAG: hypothetical protein IJX83_14080 [Lachnospiraceae bacterium]|nr:hypothetical protein [Lachnospiraceae bacterium]